MAKRIKVLDDKFIIYPFGKWWIGKDTETTRVVAKGNSRRELMSKLEQLCHKTEDDK